MALEECVHAAEGRHIRRGDVTGKAVLLYCDRPDIVPIQVTGQALLLYCDRPDIVPI